MKVSATRSALSLLSELKEKYGEKLMFHQSGGCCDGSAPMCFQEGEFPLGDNDIKLGEIGGVPFYMNGDQYEKWKHTDLTIDAVKFIVSTITDTDTTINVHLYSFDMANTGGTNDGNLSNGTVLADGQATSVDKNVIKSVDMTIQSSSVTSGKVIALAVENVTNTDYINIQVQVKYHIA